MSGLNVGYLSIDKLVLELLENGKDEDKKYYVKSFRQKKFNLFSSNITFY